jgi:hypothetical protein
MKVQQWQADKRWYDRFIPEIKGILGVHLIGEPPMEEDAERNTDLMVLKLDAVRIGCRIRKHQYAARYGSEFTIRAGRPSGTKTELTKIIEGWGDYFFYGFSDPDEYSLSAWVLLDLKMFRSWFVRELSKLPPGQFPGIAKNNTDTSSNFAAFNIDWFPKEMIVARRPLSHHAPPANATPVVAPYLYAHGNA